MRFGFYLKFAAIIVFLALPYLVFAEDINHELINAARKGDVNKVQSLIARGADINASDRNGNALFSAVNKRNDELVKLLLESGADPNAGAFACGSAAA